MTDQEKQLNVLLSAGLSETVALSMLKSLQPKEKKAKKYYGNSTKREKINVPIVVHQTCVTCKTVTSFKQVMQVYSDEADQEQSCVIGQCINCIKQYELMTKEELISLIVIQNHVDMELRGLSTASQIVLAKKRSAKEWLTMKMNHAIAWGDKDAEGYIEMPDVKVWRK
jgi:reverse gyrase